MSHIVFRADGGPSIGAGHIMRCMSFAESFRANGWRIGFAASRESFDSVAALARSHQTETLQAGGHNVPLELRKRWPEGVDILVVDHYQLDAAFERACRPWASRIVSFDDLADRPHETEVVVDAAGDADQYRQRVPDRCAVLTGPRFAILNSRFRAVRRNVLSRDAVRDIGRVLIGFGQMDAPNATLHAIEALDNAGYRGRVDVVLGRAAPNLAAIRAKTSDRIRLHVDSDDIPLLLAEADLAIGAGGMSSWERCCVGVPSILVMIAANQRATISQIADADAGVDAGEVGALLAQRLAGNFSALAVDRDRRQAMSRAAARLVDGRGAERVMLAAVEPAKARDGSLTAVRLAETDDEKWLLELQSHPETREFANDPAAPTPDSHARWFTRVLDDSDRLLMIVEYRGRRAGMLRLDRTGETQRVSIAIDPASQRQGLGAAAIQFASRLVPGQVLEAEVLPDNNASLALFQRAGYRQVGTTLFRREVS